MKPMNPWATALLSPTSRKHWWLGVLCSAFIVAACGATSDVVATVDPGGERSDPGPVIPTPEGGPVSQPLCVQTECPAGRGTCTGADNPYRCGTKLLSDRNNCGECGNVCPDLTNPMGYTLDIYQAPLWAQSECIDGKCTLICRSAVHLDCDNSLLNGCETDSLRDVDNCGACGHRCDVGQHCIDGQCGCPEGTTDCGDSCSTLTGDAFDGYCGACGDRSTIAGALCKSETKGWECPPGSTVCSATVIVAGKTVTTDTCVDTNSDDANCGKCGFACPQPPEDHVWKVPPNSHYGCVAGSCGASGLNPGPPADPNHPVPPPLANLKCDSLVEYDPGWLDCDGDLRSPASNGCEVNPTSLANLSDQNCGGCGIVAPPGHHCFIQLQEDLITTKQVFSCNSGKELCGFDLCQDLQTDTANCGACRYQCPGFDRLSGIDLHVLAGNATIDCVQGGCTYACLPGFGDCNGIRPDDCETNLLSSPDNCGSCGNACAPGQPCIDGVCLLGPCEVTR